MSPTATTRTNGFCVGIGARAAIPLPLGLPRSGRGSCRSSTQGAWAGDMQRRQSEATVRPDRTQRYARQDWRGPCVFLLVGVATHHPDDVRVTSFYRDV